MWFLTMPFSSETAPAWVQAIGSVAAIFVAIWVPARQRKNSLRDAAAERSLENVEHLRRLTAGLRAEINEALDAARRREEAINGALAAVAEAVAAGAQVKRSGPITPGTMTITDAIIYRQVAAEIGRLPPDLIRSAVKFYALAFELVRVAEGASSALDAYKSVRGNLPGLRMHAALLIATLDKFESSGFVLTADIRPSRDEIHALAAKVGYPLDAVLKERGLTMEGEPPAQPPANAR